MAKVEVEITPAVLKLRPGTHAEIERRRLPRVEAQALAGIDGDGNPLLSKTGEPLDLHQSGALWKETVISEGDGEAELSFTKDYARYVFKEMGGKYKSLTLAPQNQASFEAEIEPLLAEAAYIEEEEV